MRESETILSLVSSEKLACQHLGFVRGDAFFHGKLEAVIPNGTECELKLSRLNHRRGATGWERQVTGKRIFSIPLTTRFWRPPSFSGFAFQFMPFPGQGVFIGFITYEAHLELARKYGRHK
jgi:hypothetical protein